MAIHVYVLNQLDKHVKKNNERLIMTETQFQQIFSIGFSRGLQTDWRKFAEDCKMMSGLDLEAEMMFDSLDKFKDECEELYRELLEKELK